MERGLFSVAGRVGDRPACVEAAPALLVTDGCPAGLHDKDALLAGQIQLNHGWKG